ncbi:MAG: hypothetical protein HYR75_04705 [Gemmatimonadetes bacterium]|nr:hypothetical protein [Gemmatimonadota bacterium]
MRFFRSTFVLAVALAGSSAWAQAPITASTSGRGTPGGSVVATLLPGARVVTVEKRDGAVFVILEGWIDEKRLGGARDSFPESVGGKLAMRVHTTASKNGKIIAELHAGSGVTVIGRSQGWAKVRRGLWVSAKAVGDPSADEPSSKESAKAQAPAKAPKPASPASKVTKASPPVAKSAAVASPPATKSAAVASPPPTPAAATPAPADAPAPTPMPPGALRTARGTSLQTSPTGTATATLASGTVVEPIVRDRGWVKVRVEGLVNERDLAPTDSTFSAQLTAADLRADPEGTKGKVVRWEVQLLALQYADVLRRDLAPDEPYFLARGPGTESALLYLAVPPSMLKDAKLLAPLTTVIVTARVRTGHSDPGGAPILDLRSIAKR